MTTLAGGAPFFLTLSQSKGPVPAWFDELRVRGGHAGVTRQMKAGRSLSIQRC